MNAPVEFGTDQALASHEGLQHLSAPEAILKATLESDFTISLIAGARHEPFDRLFDTARRPKVIELLARHETSVVPTHDAGRAVRLSLHAAQAGQRAVTLVPNRWLDPTLAVMIEAAGTRFDGPGAMCFILEDHPALAPASCPRRAAQRLGLPCLEPSNLNELRAGIDDAMRLSRAGRCPIALVAHTLLLRSSSTLAMRPNRVPHPAEVVLPRRRRDPKPRWGEAGGVMRMARRLEINRLQATPNPGERVGVGFIAVGPAHPALQYLADVFGLQGRIPILKLGLISPIDDVAVSRMLTRCEHVVLLEPRPGSLEPGVLRVAESIRRAGDRSAIVWNRELPPRPEVEDNRMTSDFDLHPSVLIRRISHLFQDIRPAETIGEGLVSDDASFDVHLPPRSSFVGSDAALGAVHELLESVDGWLRDDAPLEERSLPGSTLVLDGREPSRGEPRVVQVETWGPRRFQSEGLAALLHAAQEDGPWVFVICEASNAAQDFERLARAAIPGDRAARVKIESGNLDDLSALEETLREAALSEGMTVLIVRDGPPPRYDVAALDRLLEEVDQLGYQPRQRVTRAIDEVCSLQLVAGAGEEKRRQGGEPRPLETKLLVEQHTRRSGRGWRVRLKPLLEQIEVVRTRSPARTWRYELPTRLPIPNPIHARQSEWRAHLAGYRSQSPGVAARVLSEAGRHMGYVVQTVFEPTPIGPGRRAWTEVLFTRASGRETPRELVVTIPYGEADLLIGLDPIECGRAIRPDRRLRVANDTRTHAVVNLGHFSDEIEDEQSSLTRDRLVEALRSCTREDPRLLADITRPCRQAFRSDRIVDLALLGAAFQLGLIPITIDAALEAARRVEAQGYGGLVDAFEFGRRLALNPELSERPNLEREQRVRRHARRIELTLARSGWGRTIRASRFRGLVDRSLKAMPGLAESDAGRRSRRTFVTAVHRCLIWGGFDYADRYADLITQLYHADRGDRGRLVTRLAILPLAEVMLIRDPFYLAALVCDAEHRRTMRRRLNVKRARGDEIEFRYLTRFEWLMRDRRMRLDLRSSDWTAQLLSRTRRLVPLRLRGSRRERDLRDAVAEAIRRVTNSEVADYEAASELFRSLHDQAGDGSLRLLMPSDITPAPHVATKDQTSATDDQVVTASTPD